MCELLYVHHLCGKKNPTKQNPCVRSGTSCDAVLSFCVGAEPNTGILQEYYVILIRESSLACLILLFKTMVSLFRCEIIFKNPFMGIFSPRHSIIKDTVVVTDSYYLLM